MPRIVFLGDLMLGRQISKKLADHAPHWFWGDVLPILQGADGVIANLEAPITKSSMRWKSSWKMFHFRANPLAIRILECGNIRFVCLANNHVLDFSEAGLLDTLATLDIACIRHAGAGRTATDAASMTILDLLNFKVGLIAATDTMRPFAAGPNRPGTNFIEIGVDQHNLAWIEQSVQDMRRANADLLVLSLHWGSNLRTTPTQRFRSFAHAAIERGIDVIHGHSAHVAQAVECYKSGLILYGTGNSIDDSWKVPFYPTTTSFAFVLDIENCQLIRLKMIPVQLRGGSLGLATGEAFDALGKRMRSLCMDVNTSVIDTPAGLEIILS